MIGNELNKYTVKLFKHVMNDDTLDIHGIYSANCYLWVVSSRLRAVTGDAAKRCPGEIKSRGNSPWLAGEGAATPGSPRQGANKMCDVLDQKF